MPALALELSTAPHASALAGDVLFGPSQRHTLRQTIGEFWFGDAITHNFVALIFRFG